MDLMSIDLLESSKAIGLCPMGNKEWKQPQLQQIANCVMSALIFRKSKAW